MNSDAYYDPPDPPFETYIVAGRECGQEIEAQIVTPGMTRQLLILRDGIPPGTREWTEIEVERLTHRARERAIDDLLLEWGNNQSIDFECTFDGEVDVVISQGTEQWTCPGCGYEHTANVDYDMEEDR